MALVKTPEPMKGAALVYSWKSVGRNTKVLQKKDKLFNCLRKIIHSFSSSRHELVRDIWSSTSSMTTEDARERRCEMKGHPCGIMRIAKFRWPSRQRSSRLEQFQLSSNVDETRIILLIFSLGKED